jgi:hypothetical protein
MRSYTRTLLCDWFLSDLNQYFLPFAQQIGDSWLLPVASLPATTTSTAAAMGSLIHVLLTVSNCRNLRSHCNNGRRNHRFRLFRNRRTSSFPFRRSRSPSPLCPSGLPGRRRLRPPRRVANRLAHARWQHLLRHQHNFRGCRRFLPRLPLAPPTSGTIAVTRSIHRSRCSTDFDLPAAAFFGASGALCFAVLPALAGLLVVPS